MSSTASLAEHVLDGSACVHSRLDYPGIGPEHSYLMEAGRAQYYAVTDADALAAFQHISQLEGIIPALETSHAFAYLKVRLPAIAVAIVSIIIPSFQ